MVECLMECSTNYLQEFDSMWFKTLLVISSFVFIIVDLADQSEGFVILFGKV